MELKNLTDNQLIDLCNDIYDWDTNTDGTINREGSLVKFIKENKNYYDVYHLKDMVLFEAGDRFTKVAKMLIRNRPTWIVK